MSGAKSKVKVILIGGSGYAGFEAVRLLLRHPMADLIGVYGPEDELGPLEDFYPLLSGQTDLHQELFAPEKVASLGADLAMLCVPHRVAMSYVPALRDAGLRVIDFSADYRFPDPDLYEKWYVPHTDREHLAEAVYGLPEYYREKIKTADLVANPGCYPTCAVLALAAPIEAGLIEPEGIVVNAITGVSGAGRSPAPKFHFPECNENFEPYGAIGNHRHSPEMEQVLTDVTGTQTSLLFQAHLSPMDRGMLCSIYANPVKDATREQITELLQDVYAGAPFVRVRTKVLPGTKYVTGTNFCDISAHVAKGKVILFSALDNLIKGASGQGIQNMNVMFGLPETMGL